MFFRCSGVTVGDNGGEEGASVGDDDTEDGGIAEGSNSRSGIGGVTKGLRVNLRSRRRSTALQVLSHELFLLHDLSLGNSLYHLNHDYTPLSVLFLFLFRQSHVLASRKIRKLSFEQCKHRVLHRVVLEVFDLVSAGSIQGCGVSVRGLFVL